MRVLRRFKTHDGGIQLKLVVESHDDLWCLYNICFKGDVIEAFTSRKIKSENCSSICVKQEIKKFMIKLAIESIEYTSSYDDLHISGRNASENPYIKVGQYHTIDVSIGSTITLYKDEWNGFCEGKLSDVSNSTKQAELAFLVIDNGVATFFLLTQYTTKQVFKIYHNIPIRKSSNTHMTNNQKASETFYKLILEKLGQCLDFTVLKSIVVTGPGMIKESFLDYIRTNALNLNYTEIHKNINRFILCNSSFSDRNAITEVLANTNTSQKISSIQYVEHDKILKEVKMKLETNDDKLCIGMEDITNAVNLGAVDRVLVSDFIIRNASAEKRKEIQKLVDDIKGHGGKVYFLSDAHCATEYIKNLTGIVALLRFSIV